MNLDIGDRVEHILCTSSVNGTVEHAGKGHVRVRWDDGTVGLLYDDQSMVCQARHLIKLRPIKKRA